MAKSKETEEVKDDAVQVEEKEEKQEGRQIEPWQEINNQLQEMQSTLKTFLQKLETPQEKKAEEMELPVEVPVPPEPKPEPEQKQKKKNLFEMLW